MEPFRGQGARGLTLLPTPLLSSRSVTRANGERRRGSGCRGGCSERVKNITPSHTSADSRMKRTLTNTNNGRHKRRARAVAARKTDLHTTEPMPSWHYSLSTYPVASPFTLNGKIQIALSYFPDFLIPSLVQNTVEIRKTAYIGNIRRIISRTGEERRRGGGRRRRSRFGMVLGRYFGKAFLGKLLMVLPFVGFSKFRFH